MRLSCLVPKVTSYTLHPHQLTMSVEWPLKVDSADLHIPIPPEYLFFLGSIIITVAKQEITILSVLGFVSYHFLQICPYLAEKGSATKRVYISYHEQIRQNLNVFCELYL